MSIAFLCHNCANRLEVAQYMRKKIRCPACGVMCEVPPESQAAAASPAPAVTTSELWPQPQSEQTTAAIAAGPPPSAPALDDDQEGLYTATPPQPRCPQCELLLADDAEVCLACGFRLHADAEDKSEFKRIVQRWQAGWPLETRVRLLVMAGGVGLGLGLLGAYLQGDLTIVLAPWITFMALLTFILGTFYRLDLRQNKRGKVWLTRTWRICFVEREPVRIFLKNYEGVITGMGSEADGWAWLMLFLLLPFGILPGFLWWYYVIYKDTYYAALSHGHGGVDLILYRGLNERQAEDIARTLVEVAAMPRFR